METGKVFVSILAAAAAGAALGVLFAPEKGTVLRRRILRRGDNYVDDIKEKFNDFLEEVRKDVDRVKEKATEFAGNGAN